MASLIASYFSKSKTKILIYALICSILASGSYLLLGSYTACMVNLIGVVRIAWFGYNEKHNKKGYVALVGISLLVIISSILTYQIWSDALLLFQGLLFTYSIWQKKVIVYRWCAPFSDIIFIINDIIYFSIVGIIMESILLVFSISSIIKYYIDNKKARESQSL